MDGCLLQLLLVLLLRVYAAGNVVDGTMFVCTAATKAPGIAGNAVTG